MLWWTRRIDFPSSLFAIDPLQEATHGLKILFGFLQVRHVRALFEDNPF